MNRRQLNKKRMYRAVSGVLTEYSNLINSKPKLKEYSEKFSGKLKSLDNAEIVVSKSAAGVTKTKNELKLELVKKYIPLRSVLLSYANENKRNDILELVKLPESELKRLNDTELINKTKAVLIITNEILAGLAEYEINAEVITEIQTATDSFNLSIDKKGGGEADESSARDEVNVIYDEIDDILANHLDNLVEMQREKEPNFYNAYYSARVIKDLGGSHGVDEEKTTQETPTDNK
ncbi:MAG: hypothetical protein NTX22_14790 [Ignavibacteriales bacterium]|nr:hypothetical protein [Ignavibacteriales bacterium]